MLTLKFIGCKRKLLYSFLYDNLFFEIAFGVLVQRSEIINIFPKSEKGSSIDKEMNPFLRLVSGSHLVTLMIPAFTNNVKDFFMGNQIVTASEKAIKRNHTAKKRENPKFRLHDIASKILLDPRFTTKKEKESIDNNKFPAVTRCNKTPFLYGNKVEHVEAVSLKKALEFENHFYFGGLFHCGSVFACPICSEKISQVRAEEIKESFKIWQQIGKDENKNHTQLMITFTIPHYNDQSLDDLRNAFMLTRRNFKQQEKLKKKANFDPYRILKEKYGIKGSISGIETTWGYNGWHPHSHDILFLDRELSFEEFNELKAYLTSAWLYACKRSKVKMTKKQEAYMLKHSIDIRRAATAEEYIAKFGLIDYEKHKNILNPGWGAANEITKAHIKNAIQSGSNHFTPWDMLRIIDQFPNDIDIYKKFGKLFSEYVRAFQGKRQLFWSKGFSKKLNIYILSDSKAVEQEIDKFEIVGFIPKHLWRKIIKCKIRGLVLYKARELEFDKLMEFVDKYDSG